MFTSPLKDFKLLIEIANVSPLRRACPALDGEKGRGRGGQKGGNANHFFVFAPGFIPGILRFCVMFWV